MESATTTGYVQLNDAYKCFERIKYELIKPICEVNFTEITMRICMFTRNLFSCISKMQEIILNKKKMQLNALTPNAYTYCQEWRRRLPLCV